SNRSTVPTAAATSPIARPTALSTAPSCAQNASPLHRYSRSAGATTARKATGNTTSMGCTGCLRMATRLSTVRLLWGGVGGRRDRCFMSGAARQQEDGDGGEAHRHRGHGRERAGDRGG